MSENNQTIKRNQKGRGGARPNAGRKKSAATVKTRAIADKVITQAKEGDTPLEVMLRVMAGFMEEADRAGHSDDPDERKTRMKLLVLAKDAASAAAPYVHPRLAAIDHTTNGKDMAQNSGVLLVPAAVSEEDWESGAE